MTRIIIVMVMLTALVNPGSFAGTSDSAFTYQGQLKQGDSSAEGSYDLSFSLWNALSGGGQIGSTITLNNVPVADGQFTVELDFGASAFNNSARWLQIVVEGVTLSPRQPITRAPYAIQTRGMFVDEAGNIGIGTTSPVFPLHIETDQFSASKGHASIFADNLLPTGFTYGVFARSNSPSGRGIYGEASASFGTTYGVHGHTDSPQGYAAYFTGADGSSNYFQRNVGIGVADPDNALDAEGGGFSVITGVNTDTKDGVYGVLGRSFSGRGVGGIAEASSGDAAGVHGSSFSTGGTGVEGFALSDSGITTGVSGEISSPDGRAIYGLATSTTGTPRGVLGNVVSPNGYAGYFIGGRNYMDGFLGLNKLNPAVRLDVVGSIQYTGTITDVSDVRLKENIEPVVDALDKVMNIEGVYFTMKETSDGREVGLIAQNVQQVLPEAVRVVDPSTGHLGVSYPSLIPLLIEAVKALRAEKDAEIDALRQENSELCDRVERLELAMQELASAREGAGR